MKQNLTENDRTLLDQRIAEAEKLTRTQILLATVKRSDSYVEIPWKAFALGTSITGLLVFVLVTLLVPWISNTIILMSLAIMLASGAFLVLLTILFPGFARLFLSSSRADTEIQQYAESLFLSRELFSTTRRTAILLLVSRFERKVVILPDKGVSNRISRETMKGIITKMARPLARKEIRSAMEIALDEFIRILGTSAPAGPENNELPDEIMEEKEQ